MTLSTIKMGIMTLSTIKIGSVDVVSLHIVVLATVQRQLMRGCQVISFAETNDDGFLFPAVFFIMAITHRHCSPLPLNFVTLHVVFYSFL